MGHSQVYHAPLAENNLKGLCKKSVILNVIKRSWNYSALASQRSIIRDRFRFVFYDMPSDDLQEGLPEGHHLLPVAEANNSSQSTRAAIGETTFIQERVKGLHAVEPIPDGPDFKSRSFRVSYQGHSSF